MKQIMLWTALAVAVILLILAMRTSMDGNSKIAASTPKPETRFPANPNIGVVYETDKLKEIYLAGGCFWGVEAYMVRIPGVADAQSGYANGNTTNPSYEDVSHNNTGHAETVLVRYDPEKVSLQALLRHYFKIIDPTSLNKQGDDQGVQYRSGIYYKNPEDKAVIDLIIQEEAKNYTTPIVTEVLPLQNFTLAEDYHQDYLEKNPNGYCHIDFSSLKDTQGITVDPALYMKPSDAELKEKLTALQYQVTQKGDTEQPYKNTYWDNHEAGIYVDITTGEPLFSSKDKYESGTGWPSFTKPIAPDVVKELTDKSLFMTRVEVQSRVGGSHLGHVFTDGPKDQGGLRYCLNSASLRFIPVADLDREGYGDYKNLFE